MVLTCVHLGSRLPMLRRVCWPRGSHARKVNQGLPVSAHLGLSGHWQDFTQYKESSVLDEIK